MILYTQNGIAARLMRWLDAIKRRRWMRRFHDSIDIGPLN